MKQRQKILAMLLMSALTVNSFGTVTAVYATEETASESETMDLQILASSDTHAKFTTWDYAVNAEDTSGSMVQMSTAIDSLRNENTILVDAGDTIQGNSAELFLDEDIHPMILSQNEIGYDVCVTGNHEYNYGMDVLKKIMAQQESKPLVGNVYDEDGEAIADDYTIIEKNGVKVGIIGAFLYTFMVLERSISMVMINGEAKEIAGKNLLEYLKENGFNPEQLVVERNFEIISKEQFGSVTIQDEDVIEVLRFVGGG